MSHRLTTKDFIEKAKQVHGDKYDYSQTTYTCSRDKLMIVCPKHGPFEQRASSHLLGCGCPGCQKEWSDEHKRNHTASTRRSLGMTTDEWIERAKFVHGDKYDYSEVVYVNQRVKVKIICPKHGPFMQQADSHIRGVGCPKCGYESEKHIGVHEWSDEQRRKIAETCMQRYGASRYLDSAEGQAKAAIRRADPAYRAKMHDIISSDEVQEKMKKTCIEKYGVASPMSLPETINKAQESKTKNHSWNTSKPEEKMYGLLCDKFETNDVVRQYKDQRYPFRCDFYIRSLDLFIELNATWLHGGMWFDATDPACISQLDNWRMKVTKVRSFYTAAIRVWTVSDVAKRNAAVANDLNYLVFWKSDLSDFKEWLRSEPLLLNNVSK